MSTPLLVRHPAPYPTEGLAGYVLRLSEINGYTTTLSLYRLAGMEAKERSWTNFAYAKFAAIANLPVADDRANDTRSIVSLNIRRLYVQIERGGNSHIDYWTQQQSKGALPRDIEYEEAPRGRVTYSRVKREFFSHG